MSRPSPVRFTAVLLMVLALLFGSASAASATRPTSDPLIPVITSMSGHKGLVSGGTTITIHARNLSGMLIRGVSIADRPISWHRLTTSTFVVHTPSTRSAGKVWVRVRTDGGTSNQSAASSFVYHYAPPHITSLSEPVVGTWGGEDKLVVRGVNLYDVAWVTVGGSRIRDVSESGHGTAVLFWVPGHAPGRVALHIRTGEGTLSAVVRYVEAAQVTGLARYAGPVAGGQTVTVYGEDFLATSKVLFGSSPATGVHVIDASTITAITPARAAGPVRVNVWSPGVGYSFSLIPAVYRYSVAGDERWSAPTTIDPGRTIMALDCPSESFCMATDDERHWQARGADRSWGPVSTDAATVTSAAGPRVSCPTANFCMSALAKYLWTWDGAHWSAISMPKRPDGTVLPSIEKVACASPTFCAVLSQESVATWNGGTWTTAVAPTGHDLGTVTCSADGECVVSDRAGYVVVLHDGSWSAPDARLTGAGSEDRDSGGCSAIDDCVLGTTDGAIETEAGTTAHVLSDAVQQVFCSSTTSCVAIGATTVSTFDGTSWDTPVTAPAPITAASCPEAHTCVVASGGDVRTLTW